MKNKSGILTKIGLLTLLGLDLSLLQQYADINILMTVYKQKRDERHLQYIVHASNEKLEVRSEYRHASRFASIASCVDAVGTHLLQHQQQQLGLLRVTDAVIGMFFLSRQLFCQKGVI